MLQDIIWFTTPYPAKLKDISIKTDLIQEQTTIVHSLDKVLQKTNQKKKNDMKQDTILDYPAQLSLPQPWQAYSIM